VADPEAIWPEMPPEVPPPRPSPRPDEPSPPAPAPPVPLVIPARPPVRVDEYGLLERRTVLLFGPLTHDAATRAAAQVMALDAEGEGEISFHLSCQDGDLLAALMLAETIDLATSPVIATAKGMVADVALAPFTAADRRVASSRATFRLSEPTLSLEAAASDLTTRTEELLEHADRLRAWISEATGQPPASVLDDMKRGRLLDAGAALDYGLLDEIVSGPRAARSGLPASP
jgi:ATP-dependent Clp protease, protease subunit